MSVGAGVMIDLIWANGDGVLVSWAPTCSFLRCSVELTIACLRCDGKIYSIMNPDLKPKGPSIAGASNS